MARTGLLVLPLTVLLAALAVGCTSAPATPGTAADSPKQVLPVAPSVADPALPSPEPKSTTVPKRDEETYLAVVRASDPEQHEFQGRSDQQLLAVGDGWCGRVAPGAALADSAQWIVGQGYTTRQALAILSTAQVNLCGAKYDLVMKWLKDGTPGFAV
ncbi:DUF732 domain-containing protein [Kitasatospora sp. NPDC088134]|uniref:DUF732 domain-containing protein n=1 Tax=Kitasatospora sp. NPDC088134 TaxID=3364071 RepID=UPI00380A4EAD